MEAPDLTRLCRRQRQTLRRLLIGDSEKQIARHLGLSQHTVHVYIKQIYRMFDVSARGELLAAFVPREIVDLLAAEGDVRHRRGRP